MNKELFFVEKHFDKTIEDRFGLVYGNKKLVLIKTGRGGGIYGYNNKYLNLAYKLHEQLGCSVVISVTPTDSQCVLKDDLDVIKKYMPDYEDVIFIGVSAGALLGAQQGHLNNKITHMLLINGPLMINWPKTKKSVEAFNGKIVEIFEREIIRFVVQYC